MIRERTQMMSTSPTRLTSFSKGTEPSTPHSKYRISTPKQQLQHSQIQEMETTTATAKLQSRRISGGAAEQSLGGAEEEEQPQKRNRKQRQTFNIASTSGKTYAGNSVTMEMLAHEEQQIADADAWYTSCTSSFFLGMMLHS